MHEATGRRGAPRSTGCMHACGHDGHTATLLATARWLQQHHDELPGPVTLLFQPAEEGGHGARGMIEDGALDGRRRHLRLAQLAGHPLRPGRVPRRHGHGRQRHLPHRGHRRAAATPASPRPPRPGPGRRRHHRRPAAGRGRGACRRSRPPSWRVTSIDAPSAATVTPATARLGRQHPHRRRRPPRSVVGAHLRDRARHRRGPRGEGHGRAPPALRPHGQPRRTGRRDARRRSRPSSAPGWASPAPPCRSWPPRTSATTCRDAGRLRPGRAPTTARGTTAPCHSPTTTSTTR